MERIMKKVSDSRTEQIQILMPAHINGYKRLFGGKLVEWIDVVAAVVARRHSGCNVTTASIDNLVFKEAAYVNSTVLLVGQMTYVGKTSMEVRVDTFVEALDKERRHVNRAYLVMVALGEDDKPMEVPGLILETEDERVEWEAGVKRHALRRQRRMEKFLRVIPHKVRVSWNARDFCAGQGPERSNSSAIGSIGDEISAQKDTHRQCARIVRYCPKLKMKPTKKSAL